MRIYILSSKVRAQPKKSNEMRESKATGQHPDKLNRRGERGRQDGLLVDSEGGQSDKSVFSITRKFRGSKKGSRPCQTLVEKGR